MKGHWLVSGSSPKAKRVPGVLPVGALDVFPLGSLILLFGTTPSLGIRVELDLAPRNVYLAKNMPDVLHF